MKKIVLVLAVAASILALTVSAHAASSLYDGTSTMFGTNIFKPSAKVFLYVDSEATKYCAASQHSSATNVNGGLQFGTTSVAPSIDPTTAASTCSVGGCVTCNKPT